MGKYINHKLKKKTIYFIHEKGEKLFYFKKTYLKIIINMCVLEETELKLFEIFECCHRSEIQSMEQLLRI